MLNQVSFREMFKRSLPKTPGVERDKEKVKSTPRRREREREWKVEGKRDGTKNRQKNTLDMFLRKGGNTNCVI